MFRVMKEGFGVDMMRFNAITDSTPYSVVGKIRDDVLDKLDPLSLNSVFQSAVCSKSAAISLAVIHDHISIEEAVRASRIDEDYQTQHFGVVEGAHDLDEAYLYSVFSTAKTITNLGQLRELQL